MPTSLTKVLCVSELVFCITTLVIVELLGIRVRA